MKIETNKEHPGGYGGWKLEDTVYLEGFEHALVMAWNSDNRGPMDEEQILSVYNETQMNFPNANRIFAATFDSFIDALEQRPDVVAALPVYDGEIGNTWNYGAASDPYKVSATLKAQRLRTECIESHGCSLEKSPSFYNFSRFLFVIAHTLCVWVWVWIETVLRAYVGSGGRERAASSQREQPMGLL